MEQVQQKINNCEFQIFKLYKSPNVYVQFEFFYGGLISEIDAFICNEFCTENVKLQNAIVSGFYAYIYEQISAHVDTQALMSTSKPTINSNIYAKTYLIGITFPNDATLLSKIINSFSKTLYEKNISQIVNKISEVDSTHSKQDIENVIRFLQMNREYNVTVIGKLTDI